MNKKPQGFTLMELLIVIAIFVILAVIILPMGINFYKLQIFNKTTEQAIDYLKQARSNAYSQKYNNDFGLYIENKKITLFQGESYDQREEQEDVSFVVPQIVSINGFQEIVFDNNSGEPNIEGSLNISMGSRSEQIMINKMGLITY